MLIKYISNFVEILFSIVIIKFFLR